MITGNESIEEQTEVEDTKLENVTYLGNLLTYDNDCSKEIGRRIRRANRINVRV